MLIGFAPLIAKIATRMVPDKGEDDEESAGAPAKVEKPSALESFKLPISNQLLLGIAVIVPLLISTVSKY